MTARLRARARGRASERGVWVGGREGEREGGVGGGEGGRAPQPGTTHTHIPINDRVLLAPHDTEQPSEDNRRYHPHPIHEMIPPGLAQRSRQQYHERPHRPQSPTLLRRQPPRPGSTTPPPASSYPSHNTLHVVSPRPQNTSHVVSPRPHSPPPGPFRTARCPFSTRPRPRAALPPGRRSARGAADAQSRAQAAA